MNMFQADLRVRKKSIEQDSVQMYNPSIASLLRWVLNEIRRNYNTLSTSHSTVRSTVYIGIAMVYPH